MKEAIKANLYHDMPIWFWWSSFMLLCIFITMSFFVTRRKHSVQNNVVGGMLAVYVYLVFCITLICRVGTKFFQLRLIPLKSYADILNGNNVVLWENAFNILMFIPIGLLLSNFHTCRIWWKVAGVGMILSGAIEMCQYVFKLGYCETDDVIHNTLGAILGYLLFTIVSMYLSRKRKTITDETNI